MVMKELVTQIHAEMVILQDEAERNRDNPRVVAIIRALARLTDLNPEAMPAPACKHERIENGVCVECGGEIPSLQTPEAVALASASCPPHRNISPYGVCLDCKTCLHQFRSGTGLCHQCGQQVDLEATAGPQLVHVPIPTDDHNLEAELARKAQAGEPD